MSAAAEFGWTFGTPHDRTDLARSRPLGTFTLDWRELIRQLAKENAGWGYLRIKGELRKLGVEVSASTIRRVLRQHRIPPAPGRSSLTWRSFLAAHASMNPSQIYPGTSNSTPGGVRSK